MAKEEKLFFLIPSGTAKRVYLSLVVGCGVVVSMVTDFFFFCLTAKCGNDKNS